jgi:hypothetical protein
LNDQRRAAVTRLCNAERSVFRLLSGDGFVVMIGVSLGGFIGVMLGMQIMSAREMRVVAGGLVVAARRMFCGFAVMMRGALVMLGRVLVMFGGAFGVSHGRLLVPARVLRTRLNSAIVRQMSDARLRSRCPQMHETSVTP